MALEERRVAVPTATQPSRSRVRRVDFAIGSSFLTIHPFAKDAKGWAPFSARIYPMFRLKSPLLAHRAREKWGTRESCCRSDLVQVLDERSHSAVHSLHPFVLRFDDVILVGRVGSTAVTEPEMAGSEVQGFVGEHVTGPRTCAAREHDGIDVVAPVDSGLGANEPGVGRSAVGIVSARHVDFDVAETMLGQMSFQSGKSFGGLHVGDEAHFDFRDGAVGKNGFSARTGVAAYQAFNVYGWARLQKFESLLPTDVVDPVLDAHLLLGYRFVESLGGRSDHGFFSRRERTRFVGEAFDGGIVAVRWDQRGQGFDEMPR